MISSEYLDMFEKHITKYGIFENFWEYIFQQWIAGIIGTPVDKKNGYDCSQF